MSFSMMSNNSTLFSFNVVAGFSRGYAFVEYKSERDANKAWRVK